MTSIFLSYAREDLDQIRPIVSSLEEKGYSVWVDYKSLLPGQDWKFTINKAIKNSDFFIACLSDSSISKIGFVQAELKTALELYYQMPEGGIYLIPIRIGDCLIPDSLRNTHCLDWFSINADKKLSETIIIGEYSKKIKNKNDMQKRSDLQIVRLTNDAISVVELAERCNFVEVKKMNEELPTKYLLEYKVKGISKISGNKLILEKLFLVEIGLNNGYPFNGTPSVHFKSSIFHPNVYHNGLVCLGTYDLSYLLADIIILIAKMICCEVYNIHSPSNHEAAKWYKENTTSFPYQVIGMERLKPKNRKFTLKC